MYTGAVQLAPRMGDVNMFNHAFRADYMINNASLPTAGDECPTRTSAWMPWFDLGWFKDYVHARVKTQGGEEPLEFYRKYIDASAPADQSITLLFAQGARFALSRAAIHRRPKSEYAAVLATLSGHKDPYSGFFMEWLWPALFLRGAAPPCELPERQPAVPFGAAMNDLLARFTSGTNGHNQTLDKARRGKGKGKALGKGKGHGRPSTSTPTLGMVSAVVLPSFAIFLR